MGKRHKKPSDLQRVLDASDAQEGMAPVQQHLESMLRNFEKEKDCKIPHRELLAKALGFLVYNQARKGIVAHHLAVLEKIEAMPTGSLDQIIFKKEMVDAINE